MQEKQSPNASDPEYYPIEGASIGRPRGGPNRPEARGMQSLSMNDNGSLAIAGQIVDPGTVPYIRPPSCLAWVRRSMGVILAIAAVIAVPLLGAIWILIKPSYTAKAELRVRPIIPRLVFTTEDNGMIPLYQSFVNTQVAVIYSPAVLGRVLEQPEVRNTAWYAKLASAPGRSASSPIDKLRLSLNVQPRPLTEIVDLSLTARKPDEAAAILNVVLDQYVALVGELSDQTNDALYRKLADQYTALQSEINGQEAVLDKLKREIGTSTPDELLSRRRLRLDEEEAALEKLQLDIASLEWQRKNLEELVAQDPSSTQPAKRYANDPEWRRLYLDERNLQMQLDNARRRFRETSPSVIQAQERYALARELLQARQVQMDGQTHLFPTTAPGAEVTIAAELDALSRKLKLMRYEETLRGDWLKQQQADFTRTFDSASLLAREKAELAHRREMYEAVRARLEQKRVERNVPGSIDVLTRPFVTSTATKDRRGAFSVLAVMLALGGGMGLAFLRLTARQPVFQKEELPRAMQQPFLGHLPLVKTSGVEDNRELEEGIRIVRTALLARLSPTRGSALLVTSADVGAGKSTVAILLARSLAACGKKVLLVDADLRHPTMTHKLNPPPNTGLAGLLRGEIADSEAICPCQTPNLSFLQAGRLPCGSDMEFIVDGALSECLSRWRSAYDLVLLDSAPILPVADICILSRTMDGIIMVVREDTGRADLAECLDRLTAARGTLVGTVFVSRRHSTYAYDYSHREGNDT